MTVDKDNSALRSKKWEKVTPEEITDGGKVIIGIKHAAGDGKTTVEDTKKREAAKKEKKGRCM